MSFTRLTLSEFLDQLGSGEPTPGGGAAAALSGALGAALVTMVCHLTLGKKGYEAVQVEAHAALKEAAELKSRLAALMDEDAAAFDKVMVALKLPKGDPAAQAIRARTLQTALMGATEVPLEISRLCARVSTLGEAAARIGNRNAASDAQAAVLLGQAGMRAGALNVQINLNLIKDESFVNEKRGEIAALDPILSGSAATTRTERQS